MSRVFVICLVWFAFSIAESWLANRLVSPDSRPIERYSIESVVFRQGELSLAGIFSFEPQPDTERFHFVASLEVTLISPE